MDHAIYDGTNGGVVCAHVVSVPVARLRSFHQEIDEILTRDFQGWEWFMYCHVGDGALHFRMLKPDDVERRDFRIRTRAFERALFERVRDYRGSVSAEYGIGVIRKRSLKYSRAPAELEAMRARKRAFDPEGILNPGKIL